MMPPFPTQLLTELWEIDYVMAKYLHLSKADLTSLSMREIRYYISRLRKDVEAEERAAKQQLA